ncbi:hypothetical protein [Fictibacillus barbaricus]|uniref:Ferric oxidoreductase domain-containing protein n=1 Tax=Fictibacillus barbaricus TaxID=182136 RepID=A0ABU1TYZ4_9BACL|nr:hypothetical protein [Fictibacillus barbaricus]MDR7072380.1 hypothetical protein [Fictibacillus barbaricus]
MLLVKKNHWFMKLLNYAIKIILAIIISIGIGMLAITLYHSFKDIPVNRFYKGIDKNVGTMAEIVSIGAALLWLFRKIWLELKKRKVSFVEYVQMVFLTLKNFHIYFGITVLILAFSHGLFFLLNPVEEKIRIYSGIAAFTSLVLLAILGWRHQRSLKTKNALKTKKVHIAFAIIFGVIFLIHINV